MYKKNTNILIFSENIFIASIFGGSSSIIGTNSVAPMAASIPRFWALILRTAGEFVFMETKCRAPKNL
ncbi:hypothetical protein IWX80_001052 [Flavobacterium sp. CAN_S2]|jgi:hypothetical protein